MTKQEKLFLHAYFKVPSKNKYKVEIQEARSSMTALLIKN